MKPRELFEVLTRSIGLLQIVGGVALLPTTVRNLQTFRDNHELFVRMMAGALSMAGLQIILGCVMLFGARAIARWFFREDSAGDEVGPATHSNHAFGMNAQQLFGVAVRAIGIWNIAYGLWWIPGVAILLYDLSQVYPDQTFQEALWRELGSNVFRFTVGMALFFNADRVVRWAYLAAAGESPPNATRPA